MGKIYFREMEKRMNIVQKDICSEYGHDSISRTELDFIKFTSNSGYRLVNDVFVRKTNKSHSVKMNNIRVLYSHSRYKSGKHVYMSRESYSEYGNKEPNNIQS